jgi:hypothetical protein
MNRNKEDPGLYSGRFHLPPGLAPWRRKEMKGTTSEARFSTVIEVQHEKCVACEAMQTIRQDPNLSKVDMIYALRDLTTNSLVSSRLPQQDIRFPFETWVR